MALTDPTPISLDTTQPDQTISLDTGDATGNYLLDPATVNSRAFKASYGLKNTSAAVPQTDVANSIQSGEEQNVRDAATSKLNAEIQQNKTDVVTQAIANKNGPLSSEDLNWINGVPKFNTYFDPKTVFETNYANQYTSELDKFAQDLPDTNAWKLASQFNMSDVDAMKQYGSTNMAMHEFMLQRTQQAQALVHNQSWTGVSADFLKMAFPIFNPYYEIKMRGNTPGVSFWDGLLGTNLEDQRTAILSMPFNQGVETFNNIMTRLEKDNPQAAVAFGASMIGQSSSDKVLNNINTIGNLTDIPAVIKIGTIPFKAASIINQSRKAIKDINVANAISPESSLSSIAASTGDVHSAAVEAMNAQILSKISGNTPPTEQALEQLQRFFRVDKANIMADPGTLTTTKINQLAEQTDIQQGKIFQTLADTIRPTRIPVGDLTPDLTEKIYQSTLERYPSFNNSIIRATDPEVELEPISNTYHVTLHIGKNGGELFGSEEEAIQAARFHGLAVKYTPDQISTLEARIADIKDQIKSGPAMEDDAAGLNHYFGLDKQLKDLELQHAEATAFESGAKIQQQGLGYYISTTKPLKETDQVVRDFLYNPSNPRIASQAPSSLTISHYIPYLQYLRSADDTMSPEARAMRKSAIFPMNKLMDLAHNEWQYIKQGYKGNKFFSKTESDRFLKSLRYAQDAVDPDTGLPGYYFKSPGEYERWYISTFGESPSFKEHQAYAAVKRWANYDLALREIAEYKNRSRLGAETHQLISKDSAGNTVRSAQFDGVSRSKMPRNGTILIMGKDTDGSAVRSLNKMTSREWKTYSKLVEEGQVKLIEPYDSKEYPFKDFVKDGDKTIDYVLSSNVDTAPLRFARLSRRGGGHFSYDYDHYVKQAIIHRENIDGLEHVRYQGDKTVVPVTTRAEGHLFSEKMNAVRELIKANNLEGAKGIAVKHLPFNWEELLTKFKNGTFSLDEPFQTVPRNISIGDMSKDMEKRLTTPKNKWVDDTKHGLARNNKVEFTGARDAENLKGIENTGTFENPEFKFTPAQMIDPIQIMNRSMGSIVRSTFLDDYKTYAIESMMREAAPHLKNSFATDSELRSSPYAYFNTLSDKSFRPGTDPFIIQKLLAQRFKINQLVGTPSLWDTFLHEGAQKLADATYGTKAEKLTPYWMLSKLRDPFALMRSLTFDAYLGFGAIWQSFVQLNAFIPMFGITPRYTTTGVLGAMLHVISRVNKNEEILNHLDKIASAFGTLMPGFPKWKPGQWLETMRNLDASGFANVGGEYSSLATTRYAQPVQMGAQKILNLGRKPFQMSESFNRIGAWYAASKEFREAHPTGPITKADLEKILDRADLLAGNMSNASHSVINSGVLSIPTQFYNYIVRQSELFWGKRLGETVPERVLARARIIGMNMLAYGIPFGISATGLPIADYLRKEMMEDASTDSWYNPAKYIRQLTGTTAPYTVNTAQVTNKSSDWVEHLAMEGLPATLAALHTGNNYNIGPRYGNQGFNQIGETLMTDGKFLSLVSGASGSLIYNTVDNTSSFFMAMSHIIKGDPEVYPLKVEDFVDIFKGIQSVNKAWGLTVALNTHKWVNANSDLIKDVTPLNAIFMTVTGLSPQEQYDSRLIKDNLKAQRDQENYAIREFTKEMNRGFLASSVNDDTQSKEFFRRAVAWTVAFNLSSDKISEAISKAVKGQESLVLRTAWSRYVANAPQGQEQSYQNAYSSIYKALQQGK